MEQDQKEKVQKQEDKWEIAKVQNKIKTPLNLKMEKDLEKFLEEEEDLEEIFKKQKNKITMDRKKTKNAIIGAAKSFYRALPILLGVILLISLISTIIPKEYLSSIFNHNIWVNTLIATGLGSILAGNPINSYVLGGEFLSLGISLIAITAFLISWVTVGIVQLPAEIMMLGKKFAITRNILSFVFSIIIALLVVLVLNLGGLI